MSDETTATTLTADDAEQIAEGIERFIMDGAGEVDAIWQPYVNKLKAYAQANRPCPHDWRPSIKAGEEYCDRCGEAFAASPTSGEDK